VKIFTQRFTKSTAFLKKRAEKLETTHASFEHMPCKKSLDYSEKSLDQPQNHYSRSS